ncbi:MAG: hypothetical protein V4649_13950 [Bacteroidota bacterium]
MLTLSLCEKLLRLANGEHLPASTVSNAVVDELISEGIITERITGRTKRTLYIADATSLSNWLSNRYAISDLDEYVRTKKDPSATRADLVHASNDSKTQSKRTYKGFLVNSYQPITCTLNREAFVVHPATGSFQFVYDFETFVPAADVTVVGVENMESYRHIDKQAGLFRAINPLFVCRYPQQQSNDLMKWLRSLPNPYVHFGDYDFAGINIYYGEYKKHLGERSTFFIPTNIEELMATYGNRKLYDTQKLLYPADMEPGIQALVHLIHQHKKGLEQEALLIAHR